MHPGFAALFRRGTYSNLGQPAGPDEEQKRHSQEQKERFVGAMLAFGFSIDPNFRRHFLQAICGVDKAFADAGEWEALIEPKNWGDLVLLNRSKSQMIVVELKIDADLRSHQNYCLEAFEKPTVDNCKDGYGLGIRKYADQNGILRANYITLEKKATPQKRRATRLGINCASSEWHLLIRPTTKEETEIETSIYDCLGQFGISVFSARKFTKMKLGNSATQPISLLISVIEKLHCKFKTAHIDAGVGFLGINIPREDEFAQMEQLVNPNGNVIGWFGYESEPERLSFWFYCSGKNGEKQKTFTLIQKKLIEAGFDGSNIEERDNNLGLFCLENESKGDLEWFEGVFNTVNVK